jgi:hypothetical protein
VLFAEDEVHRILPKKSAHLRVMMLDQSFYSPSRFIGMDGFLSLKR